MRVPGARRIRSALDAVADPLDRRAARRRATTTTPGREPQALGGGAAPLERNRWERLAHQLAPRRPSEKSVQGRPAVVPQASPASRRPPSAPDRAPPLHRPRPASRPARRQLPPPPPPPPRRAAPIFHPFGRRPPVDGPGAFCPTPKHLRRSRRPASRTPEGPRRPHHPRFRAGSRLATAPDEPPPGFRARPARARRRLSGRRPRPRRPPRSASGPPAGDVGLADPGSGGAQDRPPAAAAPLRPPAEPPSTANRQAPADRTSLPPEMPAPSPSLPPTSAQIFFPGPGAVVFSPS